VTGDWLTLNGGAPEGLIPDHSECFALAQVQTSRSLILDVPDNQHEFRNCLILTKLLTRKVRKVQLKWQVTDEPGDHLV
jgi:hypothetical protein